MVSSPMASSKTIPVLLTFKGSKRFSIILIESFLDLRIDSSVRIITLFLIVLTILERIWEFSIKNLGFLLYKAILGPSYSILVRPDSFGKLLSIVAMIF